MFERDPQHANLPPPGGDRIESEPHLALSWVIDRMRVLDIHLRAREFDQLGYPDWAVNYLRSELGLGLVDEWLMRFGHDIRDAAYLSEVAPTLDSSAAWALARRGSHIIGAFDEALAIEAPSASD